MRRGAWRIVVGAAMAAGALCLPACGGSSSTSTTTQRTLGVVHAVGSNSGGFGHVKPRQVNYGGDGTSFVKQVHWSSWGGKKAVGHGIARWTFPGWPNSTARYVNAEVVAYAPGRCHGKLVYRRVEWFFPSRGDRFSKRFGRESLCSGKTSREHEPPVRRCKAVRIQSPAGNADHIKIYGPHLTCRQLRAFLRRSHVLRSFKRPVKLHEGRWWCGAQPAGVPKGFSCQRNDIAFADFQATIS